MFKTGTPAATLPGAWRQKGPCYAYFAWWQYTVSGRDSKFDLQLLSQRDSTCTCLNRSAPEIHFARCWGVKQPWKKKNLVLVKLGTAGTLGTGMRCWQADTDPWKCPWDTFPLSCLVHNYCHSLTGATNQVFRKDWVKPGSSLRNVGAEKCVSPPKFRTSFQYRLLVNCSLLFLST